MGRHIQEYFCSFWVGKWVGITCKEVHHDEKEILHVVLQVLISKNQSWDNTVSEKTCFKELWMG